MCQRKELGQERAHTAQQYPNELTLDNQSPLLSRRTDELSEEAT